MAVFIMPKGFHTKILNTALTPLELNKTCCIEFFLVKISVSFVKLLSVSLDEYSIFLSHVK